VTVLDLAVWALALAACIVLWSYAAAIGIIHIRRALNLPTRDLPRLPHLPRPRRDRRKDTTA